MVEGAACDGAQSSGCGDEKGSIGFGRAAGVAKSASGAGADYL